MRHKMKRTQNKSHQLGIFKVNNDKLYIPDDGVKVLLYRYKDNN